MKSSLAKSKICQTTTRHQHSDSDHQSFPETKMIPSFVSHASHSNHHIHCIDPWCNNSAVFAVQVSTKPTSLEMQTAVAEHEKAVVPPLWRLYLSAYSQQSHYNVAIFEADQAIHNSVVHEQRFITSTAISITSIYLAMRHTPKRVCSQNRNSISATISCLRDSKQCGNGIQPQIDCIEFGRRLLAQHNTDCVSPSAWRKAMAIKYAVKQSVWGRATVSGGKGRASSFWLNYFATQKKNSTSIMYFSSFTIKAFVM